MIGGIEFISRALEVCGVAVIACAFAFAMLRAALHLGQRRGDAYEHLKTYMGKALLLGLEFLVAADIIQTVIVETTLNSVLSLGLLVGVRIVLGWSIAVEIEGCWPWQVAANRKSEGGSRNSDVGGPLAAKE